MDVDAPIFGVCYGHQLIAHALGGVIGDHPEGREIGTLRITVSSAGAEDGALAQSGPIFTAQLTHMQTVLTPPPGATVLAHSDHDPHQILRYGPNALSTQFHPEITPAIMAGIIAARAGVLRTEGRDPDALRAAAVDAPFPRRMLREFVTRHTQEA